MQHQMVLGLIYVVEPSHQDHVPLVEICNILCVERKPNQYAIGFIIDSQGAQGLVVQSYIFSSKVH